MELERRILPVFLDLLYYDYANINEDSFSSFLEVAKEFKINGISDFKSGSYCDFSQNVKHQENHITLEAKSKPIIVNVIVVHPFSKHRPSGPMLSLSRNVRLSVCLSVRLSVCLFTFQAPFKRLFAPTSRSRMSNIFRDSESFGKSKEKKWSQI